MKYYDIERKVHEFTAKTGDSPDVIFLTDEDMESVCKDLNTGHGVKLEKLVGIDVYPSPFKKISGVARIDPVIPERSEK